MKINGCAQSSRSASTNIGFWTFAMFFRERFRVNHRKIGTTGLSGKLLQQVFIELRILQFGKLRMGINIDLILA